MFTIQDIHIKSQKALFQKFGQPVGMPEAPLPSFEFGKGIINGLPEKSVANVAKRAGETLKTGGETYNNALKNRLESDPRLQEALANLMNQYGKQPPEFGTMSRNDQKKFLEGASAMLSGPGGSFFKGKNINFGLQTVNTTVTDTITRLKTAPVTQPQRPVINSIHSGIAVNGGINRVGPGGFQRGAYAYGAGAGNEAGTRGD